MVQTDKVTPTPDLDTVLVVPVKEATPNKLQSQSNLNVMQYVQDIDLLLRKIDQQIIQKGQSTSSENKVGYWKIMSVATTGEMAMFYFGHFFAMLMGLMLPVFQYFLTDSFDSFASPDPQEQMEKIKNITVIFVSLAAAMWVLSYFYWVLLSNFSLRVSRRIKEKYLAAILE